MLSQKFPNNLRNIIFEYEDNSNTVIASSSDMNICAEQINSVN